MRRKVLIVLLSLGTLAGFAAGFASLRCHRGWHGGGWHSRRAALEQRVADVCVEAALRTRAEQPRR